MNNFPLLQLLESVLGSYQRKTGENYAFFCPECHHRKRKLEINLSGRMHKGKWKPNPYKCWTCGFNGESLYTLFRKLKVNEESLSLLKQLVVYVPYVSEEVRSEVKLPSEFIPLTTLDSLMGMEKRVAGKVIDYIKNTRGLRIEDVYRYNIGFAMEGEYQFRTIIPSYDRNHRLNYFVARKINDRDDGHTPYLIPEGVSKNIIPFENLIDFRLPIRIVEGVFDAITCRFNTIPMLGLTMPEALDIRLLLESHEIYFSLDKDAMKEMLKYLDYYASYGKKVYLVEPATKDPSEAGFGASTRAFQNALPYSFGQKLRETIRLKKQSLNRY